MSREYFVSEAGSDSGDGTRMRPWRSVARASAAAYQPGDRILFRGTFPGTLQLDERTRWDRESLIEIGSWGTERAVLGGIRVLGIGGVSVQDVVVRDAPLNGIEFLNDAATDGQLPSVRIDNVEVSGCGFAGIYIGGREKGQAQSGFAGVHITRAVCHRNVYYGIYVTGAWDTKTPLYANRDVLLRECTVYENPGDPTFYDNHSGNGILVDNTDGALIERCVAYRNGAANVGKPGGPCAIWAHNSNRVVIRYCSAFENRTNGSADGGAFDFDGGVTNSVMEFNESHDNDGAGYLVWNYEGAPKRLGDNVLRSNVSIGDGRKHSYGAVHIGTSGTGVTNVVVRNNVLIARPASSGNPRCIWVGGRGNRDIWFHDNRLVAQQGVPVVEIAGAKSPYRFKGNSYRTPDFHALIGDQEIRSLEEWERAVGEKAFRPVKDVGCGHHLMLKPKA